MTGRRLATAGEAAPESRELAARSGTAGDGSISVGGSGSGAEGDPGANINAAWALRRTCWASALGVVFTNCDFACGSEIETA
jgi:hypothetical protein